MPCAEAVRVLRGIRRNGPAFPQKSPHGKKAHGAACTAAPDRSPAGFSVILPGQGAFRPARAWGGASLRRGRTFPPGTAEKSAGARQPRPVCRPRPGPARFFLTRARLFFMLRPCFYTSMFPSAAENAATAPFIPSLRPGTIPRALRCGPTPCAGKCAARRKRRGILP